MDNWLKLWVPVIIVFLIISITLASTVSAQGKYSIPAWVKGVAGFWAEDKITDDEFGEGLSFLIDQNIIKVPQMESLKQKVAQLEAENAKLKSQVGSSVIPTPTPSPSTYPDFSEYCSGSAGCFAGYLTEIIDGDTIKVDGNSIQFSLVDAPEYGEYGFENAIVFIEGFCPVGSAVLVDEDDKQTGGSYGGMIAVIYCHDTYLNLNEAVLEEGVAKISTDFCSESEFSTHAWAQKYGC